MVELPLRLAGRRDAPLRRENNATASFQIVERVRAALLEGKMRPGDYLGSEKDFAADFGVSRTVARDALRALNANGIVEIRVGAQGGIRVAAGNPGQFGKALSIQIALSGASNAEVLEVQLGIEERGAELAAMYRTPEDIEEMHRLIDAAREARDDALKFLRLGWDFHFAVAAASHNRVLIIQLEAFHHVAWPLRSSVQVQRASDSVLRIHSDIAAAIKARDVERTKSIMRAHLNHMRGGNSRRDTCC
jgi:GntR family transcriptional repressor for pyruvate dehydrogenase complex